MPYNSGRERTKNEEENRSEMLEELRIDIHEAEVLAETFEAIPQGWWRIDREMPVSPKKTQISIRLDEDVVAFFRGYGHGYQTRINRVLRMYMHARLAKVLTGARDEKAEGGLL